jgi:hypothetical protein
MTEIIFHPSGGWKSEMSWFLVRARKRGSVADF